MTIPLWSCVGAAAVAGVAAWLCTPSVVCYFLFVVLPPGYLLTSSLFRVPVTTEERVMLGAGTGLAIIPCLFWISSRIHLPLSPPLFWILPVCILPPAWRLIHAFRHGRIHVDRRPEPIHLLLLGLVLVSLASRVWPVRHLEAPLFADPALQGEIVRLMLDQRGIPTTWEPLAPFDFRYPPGFASLITALTAASSLTIPRIILFFTNMMHALLPCAMYLLATALWRHRWQGLLAALVTTMAMFPTATFVAGMNASATMYFLVIIAISGTIRWFSTEGNGWARFFWWLAAFCLGGMLIHPTFGAFYLLLIVPYLLLCRPAASSVFRARWWVPFAALLLAVLCLMPSLVRATGNQQLIHEQWALQADYLAGRTGWSPYLLVEPVIFLFDNARGGWHLPLNRLALGLVFERYWIGIVLSGFFFCSMWYAIRHDRPVGRYLVAIYLIFLLLGSIQSIARWPFPGWHLLYPTRVKFLMIVPIALLLSAPACRIHANDFGARWSAGVMLVVSLLLIAPYSIAGVINYLRWTSTRPTLAASDLRAMRWIAQHVPQDRMIVNPIHDIEAGVFIGGAGQWIPAITGYAVAFPTLSVTEAVPDAFLRERIEIMQLLVQQRAGDPRFLAWLKAHHANYVFLSPRRMHSRQECFPAISPEQFLASPHYRLVYHDEDVSIFAVIPQEPRPPLEKMG